MPACGISARGRCFWGLALRASGSGTSTELVVFRYNKSVTARLSCRAATARPGLTQSWKTRCCAAERASVSGLRCDINSKPDPQMDRVSSCAEATTPSQYTDGDMGIWMGLR